MLAIIYWFQVTDNIIQQQFAGGLRQMTNTIKLGFMQPKIRVEEENGLINIKMGMANACMFNKRDLTGISYQRAGLLGAIQFMGNGTILGKLVVANRFCKKVMAELNNIFPTNK
jgi:hypothetical protein